MEVKVNEPPLHTLAVLKLAVATGKGFTVKFDVVAIAEHPCAFVTVKLNVPPVVPKVTVGVCTDVLEKTASAGPAQA